MVEELKIIRKQGLHRGITEFYEEKLYISWGLSKKSKSINRRDRKSYEQSS
jgi:hypothetical protein